MTNGDDGAVRLAMRRRRQQLKQTQEEVAAAIGVSLSTYQRWERGEQTPHLRTQKRIANHFHVKIHQVDEWFYDEPECPTCGLVGLAESHRH